MKDQGYEPFQGKNLIWRMGFIGRVFDTNDASSEEFRSAYLEMCDEIQKAQSAGWFIRSARLVNEVNEVTPTNVDRNKWFFRVTFFRSDDPNVHS